MRKISLGLVALAAVIVLAAPVSGQDEECEKVEKYDEKAKQAKQTATDAASAESHFNGLPPLKAKPAAGKDVDAAKTARDTANDKRIKAKEALDEVVKKLKPGSTAASLRVDIANKKQEISSKQDELRMLNPKSVVENLEAIKASEKAILDQMNDTDLATAKTKVNDSAYKDLNPADKSKLSDCVAEKKRATGESGFDYTNECISKLGADLLNHNVFKSSEISKLKADLDASVKATNAAISSGTSNVNHYEEIQRIGPMLIGEIENAQKTASNAFKQLELMDKDNYRELQRQLAGLNAELKTLEAQLTPITTAENNVRDTKSEFDKAESAYTTAQEDSGKLAEWEKASKAREREKTKRDKAVQTKNDTENEATKLKTDRDSAITAKDAAIATARTAAAADTASLRTWRATVNTRLMEQARTDTFNSGIFKRERDEQVLKLKQATTKAAQDKIRAEWQTISAARVQERYIGLRNEDKASAIEAVRDGADLVRYKCFNDVEEFRNKLSEVANKIRRLRASVGTGADFEFEGENEKEKINVGPTPSLDNGGTSEEPTDDVPDDIISGTGQVKVIQYFVFLLTNSSNGLYVGSEDSVKGTTRCSWIGGGIGCKPSDVITYRKLTGPFSSQADAQASLCQNITESRHFPLGVGLKGRWQGGSNWYGLWNAGLSGCSK